MAKRAFKSANFTPTAVADTTNFTNLGYMGLMGGTTTQQLRIQDVWVGGLGAASSPMPLLLARSSTVNVTPTALTTGESDGPLDPATAALAAAPVAFTQSTTKPQRSASAASIPLAFNGQNGVVRWVAPPGEDFTILGNVASFGEATLSCFNTGATTSAITASITYEPL